MIMTGFKGTRNVNGRPKGAVNKTTTNAKAVIQSLINSEVQKIPDLLDKLSAKDRLEITIKLMNFVIPKQTQIEIEANEIDRFRPITINLINEHLKIENESTD
jgi:hypothetical protein